MSKAPLKKRVIREQRRDLRLSAMGLANLTSREGRSQEVYLASICRSGLGVYLEAPVPAGGLVIITLRMIEEPGGKKLKVAARVRWVHPIGRMYMAGLLFEKMSDERYSRLLAYLHIIEAMQL